MRQPALEWSRSSRRPKCRCARRGSGFECENRSQEGGVTLGRVLITGGAGLVGSHLADALAEAGASEVVVLDDFSRGRLENLRQAAASQRLRIVEGDVRDPRDVSRAMEGASLVFHQAAIRITQCAEEPRLAKDVLVDGTFNVLEAAARAGVRKVVAASSASVYGLAATFPNLE